MNNFFSYQKYLCKNGISIKTEKNIDEENSKWNIWEFFWLYNMKIHFPSKVEV